MTDVGGGEPPKTPSIRPLHDPRFSAGRRFFGYRLRSDGRDTGDFDLRRALSSIFWPAGPMLPQVPG